jgi:hypothetical protein
MSPASTAPDAAGAGVVEDGLRAALDGAGFIAFLRNRAVGEERVRVLRDPGEGTVLEALTRIAVGSFRLAQTAVAGLGSDLRPKWCRVTAKQPSMTMSLEIVVDSERARVRHRIGDRAAERTVPLSAAPLLLVDNCFALHALAALSVLRAGAASRSWLALPAGRAVTARSPGEGEVPTGGWVYARPDLTLHLADGLVEHAWAVDGRIDRLMVPVLQMRVERTPDRAAEGGRA